MINNLTSRSTNGRKWLLRFGLAAAVLLAQSLVVSHDHSLAADTLGSGCEICLQLSGTDGILRDAIAPVCGPGAGILAPEPTSHDRSHATGLPKPRGPPQVT